MSDTDSDQDLECRPLEDEEEEEEEEHEIPSVFGGGSSKQSNNLKTVYDAFDVDFANNPLVLPSLRSRNKVTTTSSSSYIDPDVQMELNSMMGSSTTSSSTSRDTNGGFWSQQSQQQLRISSSPRNGGTLKSRTQNLDPIAITTPTKPPKLATKLKPSYDQSAKLELEAILQKPALTSEDKYRVLDARDKLIRLTTSSTNDIARAVTIKGVCPDMCPEKERLMREATHHVATFEMDENSRNSMRHSHALKQYSRSSADQQIPLAHELRPEPVLHMTMQFLLHNIVDLCELPDTNLADWFHFVWDRTRSIRKDISQQDMCSIGAVNLVEQCARLHIHCAGRLVAEEPQVFSSKINSENLTKCLQSLKYLYHDLQLRSIRCANEAEFRAYVVLLNLNDCQFFWEVKQLPHAIQHSPEIQFAIKVYLALESNNYVRFFRLVRETNYMNACILMRYFTQIRVKALEIMLKTYAPRSSVPMSIEHWQYVLAFEDSAQTIQFFKDYGLQCDEINKLVYLDRSAFSYPELPIMPERNVNVVEHKRTCSVGEAIHGGALLNIEDQFEKYKPHDSFDDRGYLYAEAWTADDQNYLRPSTPKTRVTPSPIAAVQRPSTPPTQPTRPPSPRPSSPRPHSPRPSHAVTSSLNVFKMPTVPPSKSPQQPFVKSKLLPKFDSNENDTIPQLLGESQPDGSTTSTTPATHTSFRLQNIFSSPFAPPPATTTAAPSTGFKFSLSPTTTTTMPESPTHQPFHINLTPSTNHSIFGGAATQLQQQQQQQQSTAPTSFFGSNHQQSSKPMSIPHPIPVVTRSLSKEEAQRQLRLKEVEIHSENLTDSFITEFVDESTSVIAEQVVAEFNAKRIVAIDTFATKFLNDLIDKQIHTEIHVTVQELLKEATQSNAAKYFSRWRYNVRRRIERRQRIADTPLWIEPQRFRSDLSVPQHTLNLSERRRYRKGVPPPIQLQKPKKKLIDVCSLIAASKTPSTKDQYWKCLLSIPGDHPPEETRFFKWLCGIFHRRTPAANQVFFAERHRVKDRNTSVCMRLLQGSKMIDYHLAVPADPDSDLLKGTQGIVFFETTTESTEESHARLSRLEHLNLPIEHVLHQSTRQLTLDALKYLAEQTTTSIPTELQIQRTTDFLLQTLGDQFWHKIRQSAASNPALNQIMRDPLSVVTIYNEAIERLISIASEDHSAHPDFPPELRQFVPDHLIDVPRTLEYFPTDWKSPTRSERLCAFLRQLQLELPDNHLSTTTTATVEELYTQIHAYCESHTYTKTADQITSAIYDCPPTDWTPQHIIAEFARIGPAMLSYARLSQQYDKHSANIPVQIIYNASELRNFCHQPWWLTYDHSPVHQVRIDNSSKPATPTSNAPNDAKSSPRRSIIGKSEMDALVAKATSLIRNADTKIQQQRIELEESHRRRSNEAAQLNRHLRRYEVHMQRNKEMIAGDNDLQRTVQKDIKRSHQTSIVPAPVDQSPQKKRRVSGESRLAALSGIRSFVWQCYSK